MSASLQLFNHGVVVINIYDNATLNATHQSILNALTEFPEYNRETFDPQEGYVLGGFGAFGNPSSFHHPAIRDVRTYAMSHVVSLIKGLLPHMANKSNIDINKYHLEQLFDRLCIRRKGTTPTKEAWHRDQGPIANTDEEFILGGWLNLDTAFTQTFSCIPGTHFDRVNDANGFIKVAKIPEEGHAKIDVPPGHCILFFQNLLHEVNAKKSPINSLRLFLGWRITTQIEPLFPNHEETMESQGVPYIPSGQTPPMFNGNHMSFHSEMLFKWSDQSFQPRCYTEVLSGKNKGRRIVHKAMRSLKAYNMTLFPAYSEREKAMYRPNRRWTLNIRNPLTQVVTENCIEL
jgi:hypothetical protein